MGRLVIAHHKSYHPYKRENIERVRRDEEEARLKEAKEEGRMMLADSEARIDRLRERAGAKKKDKSRDDDMALLAKASTSQPSSSSLTPGSTNKHINFFEDLEEQNAVIAASTKSFRDKGKGKGKEPTEDDKGVRLAPSTADLNPWYSSRRRDEGSEPADGNEDQVEKRRRDELRKSAHDPLTTISRQLHGPSPSAQPYSTAVPNRRSASSATEERLNRESSERERARALIARKKREALGSATPSTVVGDEPYEYGDMFNKKEVREAHANRDRQRWKSRRWDDH